MEKLTLHTSFIALKADDKLGNSSVPNKKMAQFKELLASLTSNVRTGNKPDSDGK